MWVRRSLRVSPLLKSAECEWGTKRGGSLKFQLSLDRDFLGDFCAIFRCERLVMRCWQIEMQKFVKSGRPLVGSVKVLEKILQKKFLYDFRTRAACDAKTWQIWRVSVEIRAGPDRMASARQKALFSTLGANFASAAKKSKKKVSGNQFTLL